jgi:hypothetical protein
MKGKGVDRFIDKCCKIVTKEPSEERARVSIGPITDIDHDARFMIVESDQGSRFLNIESIVAIKPKKQHWI